MGEKGSGFFLTSWMVIVSFSFSPPPAKEQLRWTHPAQLTANDFRKPSAGRKVRVKTGRRSWRILEGYIYSGIAFSYEVKGKQVKYEVYAFMLPDDSWLADPENQATLEHEQAHFNITEIYARRLRQQLKQVARSEDARKKYQQTMKDLAKVQADFDHDQEGETGVTDQWKKKIQSELNERAAFSSAPVIPGRTD